MALFVEIFNVYPGLVIWISFDKPDYTKLSVSMHAVSLHNYTS